MPNSVVTAFSPIAAEGVRAQPSIWNARYSSIYAILDSLASNLSFANSLTTSGIVSASTFSGGAFIGPLSSNTLRAESGNTVSLSTYAVSASTFSGVFLGTHLGTWSGNTLTPQSGVSISVLSNLSVAGVVSVHTVRAAGGLDFLSDVVDGDMNFTTTTTITGSGGEFNFNNNVVLSNAEDVEVIIETKCDPAGTGGPPSIHFLKQRPASGAVQNGDYIGAEGYFGFDSSAVYQQRAAVSAQVDGAVSSGTVPMQLVFASGSSVMREKWRMPSGSGDLVSDQTYGGTVKIRPGANTGTLASMIGRYTSSTVAAGNATTSITTLSKTTLYANALDADNRGLRITAWGTEAANASRKTINCYLGTTILAQMAHVNAAITSWRLSLTLLRAGASSEEIEYEFVSTAGSFGMIRATAAESLTADQPLWITGQSAAGSEITQTAFLVEYIS